MKKLQMRIKCGRSFLLTMYAVEKKINESAYKN